MKKGLEKYSDEELRQELDRRFKIRRGPIVGYRAICYGDEYKYGGYADYIATDMGWTLEKCKEAAQFCVDRSENGGNVKELYKDTAKEKPERIH